MRLDLFLKSSRLIQRRTLAQEFCDAGLISVNGTAAKSSKDIQAGDEITIKTGSAVIVMKKNGDITIKGKDILIDASGKIDQKASGNITQKGQKVLQN